MHPAITSPAMPKLQGRLRGDVACPGDARYDRSRHVCNGRIDRYPTLIVYYIEADDVLAIIDFARSAGLPLTVRGDGHRMVDLSVCSGGVVIDLSRMNRRE